MRLCGENKLGERGAKSHRGKLSLAQNSIMQIGKFSSRLSWKSAILLRNM